MTLPQEDRHKFTSAPWSGGYRWFRTNVTPIEHYRRPNIDVTAPNKRADRSCRSDRVVFL